MRAAPLDSSSPDQIQLGSEMPPLSLRVPHGIRPLSPQLLAELSGQGASQALQLTPLQLPLKEEMLQLLGTIRSAGYSLRQSHMGPPLPVVDEQLATQLVARPETAFSGLTVSRESENQTEDSSGIHPSFRLLAGMKRYQVERVSVSSLQDLKDLAALAREDFDSLARPEAAAVMTRLEKAGVGLLVSGSGYDPATEGRLLHVKSMVLPGNHDWSSLEVEEQREQPPRPGGAFGAHRELAADHSGTVWLKAPHDTELTRMQSLAEASFFYLSDPHPELDKDPLACQMRDLALQGVQFLHGQSRLDAMAAYRAVREDPERTFQVALDGAGASPAPRGPDGLVQLGPDFCQALSYRQENRSAPLAERRTRIDALATPTGQSPAGKLALLQRLEEFHRLHEVEDPHGHGAHLVFGASPRSDQAMADLKRLARVAGPGRPIEELADAFLALRAEPGLQPDWLAAAVAFFHDHSPDPARREGLLELGRLGGKSFATTLEAEQVLLQAQAPVSEAGQALKALVSAFDHRPQGGFWERAEQASPPDAMDSALKAFRRLLELTGPGQSLARAGEDLGQMIERLGSDKGLQVYERLPRDPVLIDRFLREHRLSGDIETAMQCLQPGGCPGLSEPLEVREAAERLLQPVGSLSPAMRNRFRVINLYADDDDLFTPDGSVKDYRFLLTLPNRNLLEDASTLAELRKQVADEGQALLSALKGGQLGNLSGSELLERVGVELALTGNPRQAAQNVRQPPMPYEERRRQLERLRSELGGGEVFRDYQLLQGPKPDGCSFEDRLATLSRLRQALDSEGPEASRQAYEATVQSVSEGGTWAGRPLSEAADAFLKAYLSRNFEQALKSLESGPTDQGQVAGGVQLGNGSVIVGGVRLRASRA